MGGNYPYKKLVKDFHKNESEILFWAIMKQRDKIIWTTKRLYKINPNSRKLLKRIQLGINRHFDSLLNP